MNKSHTKKLVKDFPALFYFYNHRTDPLMPMAFGFGCSDGWFDLIYKLCEDITKLDPDVQAVQVKEKFGGLRFYIGGTVSEGVYPRIMEAENESYKVCEVCGKPGKPNKEGWIQTLCMKCRRRKERLERKRYKEFERLERARTVSKVK
jgi:hypothetical protein